MIIWNIDQHLEMRDGKRGFRLCKRLKWGREKCFLSRADIISFSVFFLCLPISILFKRMLKWNATHDIPSRSIHTLLHLTTGVNHGNEMKNFQYALTVHFLVFFPFARFLCFLLCTESRTVSFEGKIQTSIMDQLNVFLLQYNTIPELTSLSEIWCTVTPKKARA